MLIYSTICIPTHPVPCEYLEKWERVHRDGHENEENVEKSERDEQEVECVLPHLFGGHDRDGEGAGDQTHHTESREQDALTPPLNRSPNLWNQ